MDRNQVIAQANERGFEVETLSGAKYRGRIGGARLDFPVVTTTEGHRAEISWALAERLASGRSTRVLL